VAASTLAYCRFRNSTSTLDKRLRVLAGPLPIQSKIQTVTRALTGDADVQYGPIVKRWQMTVKLRHTELDSNYGTRADLESFFAYSNPNGSPSTIITFFSNVDTDGDGIGDSVSIFLTGDLSVENVTYNLTGTLAWYYITITFEQTV